jgi:hypothetical protein
MQLCLRQVATSPTSPVPATIAAAGIELYPDQDGFVSLRMNSEIVEEYGVAEQVSLRP